MYKKMLWFATGAVLCSLNAAPVHAHGWVEHPIARQSKCYNNGDIWSGHPQNNACREALQRSGTYPFVQRNEVAALIKDYNNRDSVRRAVPDGKICSAGSDAKDGLNIPSPDWYKTPIQLDANGQFDFVFVATAAHVPHFWEFYLTKESYDPRQPITWNDLDLVYETGNKPIIDGGSNKEFRFKVTLPSHRRGNVVLVTRWQRIDPAGEGFYNCSDIALGGSGQGVQPQPVLPTQPETVTELAPATQPEPVIQQPDPVVGLAPSSPPEPAAPENAFDVYESAGRFIPQDFSEAQVGDTVRLRTFSEEGSETTDIHLKVDPGNILTWQPELAGLFENQKSENWLLGVWNPAESNYQFDPDNLTANHVYTSVIGGQYQLSLIRAIDPEPKPVELKAEEVKTQASTGGFKGLWIAGQTYVKGDIVEHNGQRWVSKWWSLNKAPDTVGKWGSWKPESSLSNGNSGALAIWSVNQAYTAGDLVGHNGRQWKARWWIEGEEPGTTGQWGAWEEVAAIAGTNGTNGNTAPAVQGQGGASAWSSAQAYNAEQQVSHNGATWVAKWWTQGEEPGTTGEWGVWKQVAGSSAGGAGAGLPAWSSGQVYNTGDKVTHNGTTWTAQWWTQGEEPGTTGEWGSWRQ